MATSKKTVKAPSPSTRGTSKIKKSDSPRSRSASDAPLQSNDVGLEQGSAMEEVVAAVPFNATKEFEYGHENARAPRPGVNSEPVPPSLSASTSSEENANDKTAGAAALGKNSISESLERVRVDGSGQMLTTTRASRSRITKVRSRRACAARRCWKILCCAKRSRTSTTNAFPSAWSTLAGQRRMVFSSPIRN